MGTTTQPTSIEAEVHALREANKELQRRVKKLEENDDRHEKDIRALYEHQAGTKAYVEQILQKLESLETKLFNAFTTSQKNSNEERTGWMNLIQYVIGATIGVVVLYLFQQSGGK